MRKWISLIAMACSLVPALVRAQAEINCHSPDHKDLKKWVETCQAKADAERGTSRQVTTLAVTLGYPSTEVWYGKTKTVANLDFSNVPMWSDADIWAQFPLTRDKAYLTATSSGSLKRRISWLLPQEGCFWRAYEVTKQVVANGKPKPHKLFAFGGLRADIPTVAGVPAETVNFTMHVVPVVKNTSGQPIVFDAALSPCRPMYFKDWLAMMVDNIASFDQVTATGGQPWGVVVAAPDAYSTWSAQNGANPPSAESYANDQAAYLNWEWQSVIDKGLDPYALLGSSSPWRGYACVGTEQKSVSATVAPGATQTLTSTCEWGTLATGSTFEAPRGFLVTRNSKSSGNGWTITARNNTGANARLDLTAICLRGAPRTATVSTVTGSAATVSAGAYGTSSASCGSGTLIGGGYSTTASTSIMRVYNNRRSTSTGSTWQVSAQNTTSSSKTVTAYAYCLPSTAFTFSQVTGGGVYNGGFSTPSCSPRMVVNGGYTFPRTANYHVNFTSTYGAEVYLLSMDGAPASVDPNAVGYAECLAHP